MSSTRLFVLAALAVVSLTASVSAEKFKTEIGGDTLEYEYGTYSELVKPGRKPGKINLMDVVVENVRKAVESYLAAVTDPKFSRATVTWKRENYSFKDRMAQINGSYQLDCLRKYKDVSSQIDKAKAFFLNSLKKVASGELNTGDSRFSLEDIRHYAELIQKVVSGKNMPTDQAMVNLATFKINGEPLDNLIASYGSLLVKEGLGEAVNGLIGGVEEF